MTEKDKGVRTPIKPVGSRPRWAETFAKFLTSEFPLPRRANPKEGYTINDGACPDYEHYWDIDIKNMLNGWMARNNNAPVVLDLASYGVFLKSIRSFIPEVKGLSIADNNIYYDTNVRTIDLTTDNAITKIHTALPSADFIFFRPIGGFDEIEYKITRKVPPVNLTNYLINFIAKIAQTLLSNQGTLIMEMPPSLRGDLNAPQLLVECLESILGKNYRIKYNKLGLRKPGKRFGPWQRLNATRLIISRDPDFKFP